jgi:hypothetical protein
MSEKVEGRIYQFSNDGKKWVMDTLKEARDPEWFTFPYDSIYEDNWKYCRPVPADQRAEYGD